MDSHRWIRVKQKWLKWRDMKSMKMELTYEFGRISRSLGEWLQQQQLMPIIPYFPIMYWPRLFFQAATRNVTSFVPTLEQTVMSRLTATTDPFVVCNLALCQLTDTAFAYERIRETKTFGERKKKIVVKRGKNLTETTVGRFYNSGAVRLTRIFPPCWAHGQGGGTHDIIHTRSR